MNITKFSIGLIVTLVCISLSTVHARNYAIEVIIFAHVDGKMRTTEKFPDNQRLLAPSFDLEVNNEFPSSQLAIGQTNQATDQWQAIPAAEFKLTEVAMQLERSPKYRLLQHLAWVQPKVDENNALAVRINGGRDLSAEHPERLPAAAIGESRLSNLFGTFLKPSSEHELRELEGSISVVITRYIHVYADLILHSKDYIVDASKKNLSIQDQLHDYHIKLYRKMKSRELHYIDHPLVGIIIEATPMKQNEDS